jgi:hypothetical protein
MTVSLTRPEEAMNVFPISQDIAHRCRYAWKQGRSAAKWVALHLTKRIPANITQKPELRYAAVDLGEVCDWVDDSVWKLAETFGLAPNNELCQSLERILVNDIPRVGWLLDQLAPTTSSDPFVLQKPIQGDADQISMFTIFQAFFMGYYEIFPRLVDTDGLQLQIVDGHGAFIQRSYSSI